MTEMEKASISNRSTKLFTLSGIKSANRALLKKSRNQEISSEERVRGGLLEKCRPIDSGLDASKAT